MADDYGYHIDHHGSLVRPAALRAARAAGLSGDALAAATDEAVVTLAHELRRLTLNAVSDGRHVVLARQATGLARSLAARGFEPVPADMSELLKAGGGAKCCTLELRH